MNPDPLSSWIIRQLVAATSNPVRQRFTNLTLEDSQQEALQKPTNVAIEAAVVFVLGAAATEEQRQRAFDILEMFWNNDLNVGAGEADSTIAEALHIIVAAGINRANAPMTGLPGEKPPTTTLTSLSDELGIRIDPDAFAATFVAEWVKAVQNESESNHDLQELVSLLAEQASRNDEMHLGFEERLNETLRAAVQSFYEQCRDGGLTVERRRQWFEIHVVPAHKLTEEIFDDYQSGFGEVLDALRSGRGLEEAMQRLKKIQRRKITGRTSVQRIARKLLTDRALSGTSLDTLLIEYVDAVQEFKRSDRAVDEPWYPDYINKFCALIDRGEDPHLRENYPEIAVVQDLKGQLALPLEMVVDLIPKRWTAYQEAYSELRNAALATG